MKGPTLADQWINDLPCDRPRVVSSPKEGWGWECGDPLHLGTVNGHYDYGVEFPTHAKALAAANAHAATHQEDQR